jgi:hypothetical protein
VSAQRRKRKLRNIAGLAVGESLDVEGDAAEHENAVAAMRYLRTDRNLARHPEHAGRRYRALVSDSLLTITRLE